MSGAITHPLSNCPKRIIPFVHSLLMDRWKHMGIGVHRHTDVAMAQDLLYHLGVHSHAQEQCRGTVPHVMEAHVRKPCFLEQSVKELQDIAGIEWPSF